MRDGKPVGGIALGRPGGRNFPDSQIALLKTFADQAVIAIENVRLFTELGARNRDLTEALEQQTATSDILRVISQSQTDVQPVFDTIVRACCAVRCGVQRRLPRRWTNVRARGDRRHVADASGAFRRRVSAHPRHRHRVRPRSMRVPRRPDRDLMSDPDYAGAPGTFVGARTVLGVPLVRDGPRDRVDRRVARRGQAFLRHADRAAADVRRPGSHRDRERAPLQRAQRTHAQLTRSVGELRALGEVGQAVSSTLDLGTVLSTIVARARQLTGVDGWLDLRVRRRAPGVPAAFRRRPSR
jgi:hypothetical protein